VHAFDKLPANPCPAHHDSVIASALSVVASGLFWSFVQALFADRRDWVGVAVAPPAITLACAIFGKAADEHVGPGAWFAYNAVVIGLAVHAMWTIWAGRGGDLVEVRRRLRAPILVATGLYDTVVQFSDMARMFGQDVRIQDLAQGIVLAMLGIAGAAMLLRADPALLGPAATDKPSSAPPPAPAIDPADRSLAARLTTAMEVEELWRREDLSIGALASHLNTPEHRLRHLINSQMGHRNFAAFVNAYRVAAAQVALADPEKARTPVSAIAYDLGFASLTTFNRAFKDATGKTPTEWRAQALARLDPAS
jgi:AraC-like DNA-binding protein